MNRREFLDALLNASKIVDLETAINKYRYEHESALQEVPVGGRPNNRGAIEVAADAGRSAIERVTNAHDALLELEYTSHKGIPDCRSPQEAASAWLGVPEREGLAGLSVKQRQDLAAKTVIRLEPGEGKQSRLLTVIDQGIGISPEKLESTILSLNESNKIQKHYLAGTYGQGGSSTFAFSKYCVIASRHTDSHEIAFTVVRYLDLPADEYKTGHYVYLTEGGKVLTASVIGKDISHGTIVRHFGYDFTNYPSPIGPNSLYGVLNRVLFDPIASVRFENQVHGWNRVIKGVRNALNGAVDQGDETKGPELDYHLPIFNVSLGDHGDIGIEYWVLKRPEDNKKNPIAAFVDPRKPIILTHNGQNQGEITALVVRRDADLPFLRSRLICHIKCDRLSPAAKRLLFSSTREHSREGFMLTRVQEELVSLLRSDDELRRLNEQAREQSLRDHDESAQQQMRRQVAKLLRIAGSALQEVGGTHKKGTGDEGRVVRPKPPRKLDPITPKDPPTFIRLVWEDEKDISFYANQRRYIRVETDANSSYHDPNNSSASKINIAVGDDLRVFGTSPLKGGRMRIGLECGSEVVLNAKGSIRLELYRPGLPTLSDERGYTIIKQPEPTARERQATVPDFEVIAVSGPDDDAWEYICDDPNDTDISRYSSGAEMNEGKLYIYYSTVFPRFATEVRRLEAQDTALAQSFKKRYELWLAVHSLLMYQEREEAMYEGVGEEVVEDMKRQERCRLAAIAVMIANQEVKNGVQLEETEVA